MSDLRRPTFALALFAAAIGALAGGARGAPAQVQPPPPPADSGTLVGVVPGAEYEAGALRRFLLGDNYRSLWVREMTVPLLDLDRFAGGLTVDRAGGNQTRTLHFFGNDGREYIFRSIQKFIRPTLAPDLQKTLIEDLVQDAISGMHPGGAFVVAPLQRALGLLTEPITLRVMPDDPRLGELRGEYAGLVGQVLEKANEGEDDTPGTWGYTKIIGSDRLLERLEESPRHRVDTRELLAVKLLDMLVGDTDRGLMDQWRWAREPAEDGFRWRPVARDRDWAFVNVEGGLPTLVRRWYDKVADFSPELSPLATYVWQDEGLSRRLLTDLEKPEWDAVAERVVATLTDDVIDAAVAELPAAHQPGHAEWLAATLRTRRAGLTALADEYYAWLAADVDVRATDEPDRLEAIRDPDGSLLVTLYAPADELVPVAEDDDDDDGDDGDAGDEDGAVPSSRASEPPSGWRPYYTRRFLPGETDEVRVYLHGGDDVAVVRGEGARDITLRVIGGGGDDELVDTGIPSRRTALYDARGDNRIVGGPATSVDTRRYEPPEEEEGWLQTKTQDRRIQDWGDAQSWVNPVVDYREGAGLIVGAGPRWTDYGFRTHPYERRFGARLLFATLPGTLGVEAMADFRRENSPVHFTLDARATRFEAIRFYGYGNQSPDAPAADALVMMEQVRVGAALAVDGGWWEAAIGPLLLYTDPEAPALPLPALRDGDAFAQAGALARASVDRASGPLPARGFEVDAQTSAFPGLWDAPEPFGRSAAEARAYVGIPIATEPTMAFRAGAQHAWGAFPVHEAATIGGQASLRGYRWQRFAGDAALYGGAELRVPLFRVELLTKGMLGVLGLADAGRVYVDGSSPGGWHTGYGAGLWFSTMGRAFHVTWARGEEDRFYVGLEMPF